MPTMTVAVSRYSSTRAATSSRNAGSAVRQGEATRRSAGTALIVLFPSVQAASG